jgi:fatty acid/phospholipid biosynthesis enzyme
MRQLGELLRRLVNTAWRHQPESPLLVGLRLLAEGAVDALVSEQYRFTGRWQHIHFGRIEGIERLALGAPLPAIGGTSKVFMVDPSLTTFCNGLACRLSIWSGCKE